jgi:uncharacterized phiE125 gp8 family phage protein
MKIITPPKLEPVSIAEVKEQIGIKSDDPALDSIISRRIVEARKYAENYTGRALIEQTRELRWACFVDEHELPSALSVSSMKYIDTDGTEQTLDTSNYVLDTYAFIPFVKLAYGKSWPAARLEHNAVRIQYSAGYGATADAVEPLIKEAIILLIGHWMNHQAQAESGVTISRVPYAVRDLLDPYCLYFL